MIAAGRSAINSRMTVSETTTTTRRWRRTSFRRLDGAVDIAPDDWTLEDDAGQPLGRIYLYRFGPQAGRWAWFVQVDAEGRPVNGGTGMAATGREAREAVEALVPVEVELRR
jgi:hypothetical protein